MKIAYVTEFIDLAGGIERGMCMRANYLVEDMGYDVMIFCTNKLNGELFYRLNPKVKIVYLEKLSLDISFIQRIKLQARQAKEIIAYNPDVVISVKFTLHNFFFQLYRKNQKLISELREPKEQYYNGETSLFAKLYAKFREYVFKKQDLVITLTKRDKEQWGYKNIEVLNNFKMIESSTVSPLTNTQVLAVGRLHKVKGFDYLIKAWQSINKKYPNWTLKICGEGGEYNNLNQQIINLGLENSIILNNESVDVKPEYLSSSIFVLTSEFEAFGNVLVEAQTFGLPVVSFDAPHGPREIINDEQDGFLVPLFDVHTLANRVNLLIENEELRKTMGARARANSCNYDFNTIMKKYINYIKI